MKEYLQMADVFKPGVGLDVRITCLTSPADNNLVAGYIKHACESHDELVAEVAKLTDLCERFSIFCEDVGEFMGSGRNANSVRNEYMEHKLSKAP